MIPITITLTIITIIVSLASFNNEQLMDKLIFDPYIVSRNRQYYRFITSGFIHADWGHLIFNMISFYFFSILVEPQFIEFFGDWGRAMYLIMYLMALVVSLLPTYSKNVNNRNYRSLGASGAVSAVVFAGLMISPLSMIGFFIIPPIIPGFIFGPLYLILSAYLDRRGGDNVNHSAHIWGALFGVVFITITTKLFSHVDIWATFIEDVKYYFKVKFGMG